MLRKQDFTIGIEEEYLLVDPVSRDLAADPPAELLTECQRAITADVGAVIAGASRTRSRRMALPRI